MISVIVHICSLHNIYTNNIIYYEEEEEEFIYHK